MREFLFRAFVNLPTYKKVLPVYSFCQHTVKVETDLNVIEKFDRKDCIIMQYTGLKDMDGTRIFEGDIMQGPHTEPMQVIFQDGRFMFDNDGGILSQDRVKRLKIVANIYQS